MPQGGSRRSASRSPNHSWCRSAYRFRASRFRASSTAALCSPTHFGHRAVCVPGDICRRVHVAPVDRCSRQRHSRRWVADTHVRRGGAMKPPSLTLGIEEEYQIIDPTTRELKSYITELLAGDHLVLAQVKPELHQSIVEVGTTVCRTPAEVRAELVRLRRDIMGLTAKNGLRIAAAGTHPFSSWMQQEITPLERYLGLHQDMADLAQRLLIFGTHVHIGIED